MQPRKTNSTPIPPGWILDRWGHESKTHKEYECERNKSQECHVSINEVKQKFVDMTSDLISKQKTKGNNLKEMEIIARNMEIIVNHIF
jgi:uncharacterized protein YaaR (DUF327 family)